VEQTQGQHEEDIDHRPGAGCDIQRKAPSRAVIREEERVGGVRQGRTKSKRHGKRQQIDHRRPGVAINRPDHDRREKRQKDGHRQRNPGDAAENQAANFLKRRGAGLAPRQ
jgi:hypothetical protein